MEDTKDNMEMERCTNKPRGPGGGGGGSRGPGMIRLRSLNLHRNIYNVTFVTDNSKF